MSDTRNLTPPMSIREATACCAPSRKQSSSGSGTHSNRCGWPDRRSSCGCIRLIAAETERLEIVERAEADTE